MKIIPYLNFAGDAEDALNFYAEALGGEVTIMRYEGSPAEEMVADDFRSKVMHGRVESESFTIMASDVSPDRAPKVGNNVQLNIDFSSEVKQKEVFGKLAEGGNVTMPLGDQFWGAKFGMLIDKFGVYWMFNCLKGE